MLPSLPTVGQALAIGAAKPDLGTIVGHHLHLLFRQSERYLDNLARERRWSLGRPAAVEARTFWSAAFGATSCRRLAPKGRPRT
jgi:hypothetical protein